MNCKAIFKVWGADGTPHTYELNDVSGDDVNLFLIANKLIDSDFLSELKSDIADAKSHRFNLTENKLGEVKRQHTHTVQSMADEYGIELDNSDVKFLGVKILALNKVYGKKQYLIPGNTGDDTVYVIENSEQGLRSLLSHLKIKQSVQNSYNSNQDVAKRADELAKKVKDKKDIVYEKYKKFTDNANAILKSNLSPIELAHFCAEQFQLLKAEKGSRETEITDEELLKDPKFSKLHAIVKSAGGKLSTVKNNIKGIENRANPLYINPNIENGLDLLNTYLQNSSYFIDNVIKNELKQIISSTDGSQLTAKEQHTDIVTVNVFDKVISLKNKIPYIKLNDLLFGLENSIQYLDKDSVQAETIKEILNLDLKNIIKKNKIKADIEQDIANGKASEDRLNEKDRENIQVYKESLIKLYKLFNKLAQSDSNENPYFFESSVTEENDDDNIYKAMHAAVMRNENEYSLRLKKGTERIKKNVIDTLFDTKPEVKFISMTNGYSIYEIKGKYYVVQGYLTQNSYVTEQSSKEKAQSYINNILNRQSIKEQVNYNLHVSENSNIVIPKTKNVHNNAVVTVLDFKIDPDQYDLVKNSMFGWLLSSNSQFGDDQLLKSIASQFNSFTDWESLKNVIGIGKRIDSAEKLVYAVYSMDIDTASKSLQNFIGELNRVKLPTTIKSYVITDTIYSNGNYYCIANEIERNVISKEKDIIDFAKYSKRKVLQVIVDKFNAMGVKCEIASDDSITNPKAKAWIQDGAIYLNPNTATYQDALHEYCHLLLGYVKSKNPDFYFKLLDDYYQYNPYIQKQLKAYEDAYATFSKLDKIEELFCDDFGNHLMKKASPEYGNEDAIQAIFNSLTNSDIKIISNISKSFVEAFENFEVLFGASKHIVNDFIAASRKFVQDGKLQIDGEKDTATLYRKVKNYIAAEIDNENIIEDCK